MQEEHQQLRQMLSLQIPSGRSFCNTRARSLAATAVNKGHSCPPGPLLKSLLDQPAPVATGSQNVYSVSYYYPDARYRPENQAGDFGPPFFVGAPPTAASKAGPHRRPLKRSDQSCRCYILASFSDIHQSPGLLSSNNLSLPWLIRSRLSGLSATTKISQRVR